MPDKRQMNLAIPEQFSAFVSENRGPLLCFIERFTGCRHNAEEIVQDAFVRAHRGFAAFKGDSSVKTWVYRIATNLARNRWHFERRRGSGRKFSLDAPFDSADPSSKTFSEILADRECDVRAEIELAESSVLIEKGRLLLSPRHSEILAMRVDRHMSYDEIAAALRINMGTVKSRLTRARESLLATLDQQ